MDSYRLAHFGNMDTIILSVKTVAMLSIFIFLFSSPLGVLSAQYSFVGTIPMPPSVIGPESVAFRNEEGPFAGVQDGRILKWLGPNNGFADYAYTSPQRTNLCDGTTDPDKGPVCGRPLGFSFSLTAGVLYIVDAYFGFLVVGPNGGLATQLATAAEGVPFRFLSGADVDPRTGMVYFTDLSAIYELRNLSNPNINTDSTGRLLRYDPKTNQVTVLLRGLAGAIGPAVSSDSTYVLVAEVNAKRIQRLWLTGPKAFTAEIFLNLPGNPRKIKRTPFGDFWVAVAVNSQQPPQVVTPIGLRFNALGIVLAQVNFSAQYPNKTVSVITEQDRKLYTGSRVQAFIGIYGYY